MCRTELGTEVLARHESVTPQPAFSFPGLRGGRFGGALDYQNFLSAMNPSSSASANITLVLYNNSGAEEGRQDEVLYPGGKMTWRPSHIKGKATVPLDFEGAAVITPGPPLEGLSNIMYPRGNTYGADAYEIHNGPTADTLVTPLAVYRPMDNENPHGKTKSINIALYRTSGGEGCSASPKPA